ncbi:hypothetical protein HDU91_002964, partial [Kappamyces sp. JEL0680]
ESLLDESKSRLEAGDIPLDEIEDDFIRAERLRAQKQAKLLALQEHKDKEASGRFIELDDEFYIHGNVKTTAEPRPNAYIPENTGMGLPIPRPHKSPVRNCAITESRCISLLKYSCSADTLRARDPAAIRSLSLLRLVADDLALSDLDTSAIFASHKSAIKGGSSIPKHVASAFASNARVTLVPTGVTAVGAIQIEAMLGEYARQAYSIQSEKILSTVATPEQIVEESVLVLNHGEAISWILPGVKATGKEISVAVVSIVSLDAQGKITSKNVYWDQASVLKQIGVLPKSLYCRANSSEVTLPVAGAEVVSSRWLSQTLIADLCKSESSPADSAETEA